VCFLPATPGVCFGPTVWPDTCCSKHMTRSAMDKSYPIELVRNMPPLWDQRHKNYNRDIITEALGRNRREVKRYR
jgi:hypothetical protein